MIGTDRDLAAMREAIDYELHRLTALREMRLQARAGVEITVEIAKLQRERIVVCAAIVNRRLEASLPVVSFSRWANGGGALDVLWRTRRRDAPSVGCEQPISLSRSASSRKRGGR